MARNLPPLNAVRAFAAAAQAGSFTRAAKELSVTHSAVSKQIATLEDFIGAQLFERAAGGVILTDEGRGLRDAVMPAMHKLSSAFERYSRSAAGSKVLKVTTVASFAAHVLMPAMAELEKRLPGIDLQITTSDRALDLSREAVDVAIRCGPEGALGESSRPLKKGLLLPVVRADKLAEVGSLRRIHVFGGDEWAHVDEAVATEPGAIFESEHFVVAIEGVLAGIGVALLPDMLVRRFIDDGRLVTLPIAPIPWPLTFNFVRNPSSRRSDDIDAFFDALRSIIGD